MTAAQVETNSCTNCAAADYGCAAMQLRNQHIQSPGVDHPDVDLAALNTVVGVLYGLPLLALCVAVGLSTEVGHLTAGPYRPLIQFVIIVTALACVCTLVSHFGRQLTSLLVVKSGVPQQLFSLTNRQLNGSGKKNA